MSLIVKGPFLPGFTEPEKQPLLEKHLTERGYDIPEGGASIAYAFHNFMIGEIEMLAGADGFNHLSIDPRNSIIASCIKNNCKSSIWWMVEGANWQVYSGSWNEEL